MTADVPKEKNFLDAESPPSVGADRDCMSAEAMYPASQVQKTVHGLESSVAWEHTPGSRRVSSFGIPSWLRFCISSGQDTEGGPG